MVRLLITLGLPSHYHFPLLALSLPVSAFLPRWSKLPPGKTQIVQSWGWPLGSSHQGTKAPSATTSEEVNLAKTVWCSFESDPSPIQASDKTAALAETLAQPFEKLLRQRTQLGCAFLEIQVPDWEKLWETITIGFLLLFCCCFVFGHTCGLQNLSSLTKDQTHAPALAAQSQPLDHQGNPTIAVFSH